MAIKSVIFDFDGTCTQIPVIYEGYLNQYLVELNKSEALPKPITTQEWEDARKIVTENSPGAAWTISAPSAPAAADPYILASESAKYVLRGRGIKTDPPFAAHSNSYNANPAPWRVEAREVFEELLSKNISIHFVSNSSSATITHRLLDLFDVAELAKDISIQSDASKFSISELTLSPATKQLPEILKQKFENLPVTYPTRVCGRPIYLRRGAYFEALCSASENIVNELDRTVFCGDIWEMDLAMPYALGANIHLVERAIPFGTYEYERYAVDASNGKVSVDLNGLKDWL